jgi:hypothetical protein
VDPSTDAVGRPGSLRKARRLKGARTGYRGAMSPERHRYLGIYLNDHLAAATAGVELARRARGANVDTEFGPPLATLCGEIEEDRATLESIMEDLGLKRSRFKPALGWIGEKLGRLKPNGHLRDYSPLSRVVDLEVLVLGITGKLRLWTLLAELGTDETSADLPALIARAERQRGTVEDLQKGAARLL